MFSSALKSFTSNISANYSISSNLTAVSGPWKIYDGKNKSTGKAVSVFIFDRKSLEPHASNLRDRSSATSLRKGQDAVVERLRKEASSLARLRHPNILELAEPVEETRTGGLMFATEQITASLAGVLKEKDDQERVGGVGGRPSQYVVEDSEGNRRRRDLEMDELEIQKGLLQVSKGLEFLHESAGLVHGNLTPEAIYINAKSDWKISGLAFAGPGDGSTTQSSLTPIALSEALHYDPRLPRSVQLNLDYTSPDFVLDSNVTAAADLFTLGLLVIALYHFPHTSPIQTNMNVSTYKKLYSTSSTIPSQNNGFLSSRPLPNDLITHVLPRLITRRPAQRMSAKEFQQSAYFDNILVNTMRFLEELPAKNPNEKAQFMRGLPRIMPQFPNSVLEKKILVALLEETKDRELLSLILQDVFKIISMLPSGKRPFEQHVIPKLREVFLTAGNKSATQERDSSKEAGLMIVLENMVNIVDKCSGKEFKDDILPIVLLGIESPFHNITDASLGCLPMMLPVLDFSTVKHDVFPIVASVFSKTSSLGIKVRGLEALGILCGATSANEDPEAGLSGVLNDKMASKSTSATALDKYTVQDKVVPLLKAIRTKEPAVMMAALGVFQQVGKIADTDFLAIDVLPSLWSFSLGPLLNLQQFQSFMKLIKALSSKIEQEQIKKLHELSSASANGTGSVHRNRGSQPVGDANGTSTGTEGDFERLVLGNRGSAQNGDPFENNWADKPTANLAQARKPPNFSWASSDAPTPGGVVSLSVLLPQSTTMTSRSITPDHYSVFPSLEPSNKVTSTFSPLQPAVATHSSPNLAQTRPGTDRTVSNPSLRNANPPLPSFGQPLQQATSPSSFSILPPAATSPNSFASAPLPNNPQSFGSFRIAPPQSRIQLPNPGTTQYGSGLGSLATSLGTNPNAVSGNTTSQKKGLDKYESLL